MYAVKMKEYIELFEKDKYNGKKINGKHFVVKDGTGGVMLSAPHAVNHYREGEIKYADINTGVIANVLHEQCGCPIIYTCGYEEADANWDTPDKCAYKQALKEYICTHDIRLLLDIHGSKEESELAFEFGTIDGEDKSLHGYGFVAELLQFCFEKDITNMRGKRIGKNERFSAGKPETVTNYISTICGIPCIQIEINRLFREKETCIETIDALSRAIRLFQTVMWDSTDIRVYKAARSATLFPLYKVEFADSSLYKKEDSILAYADTGSFVDVRCFEKTDGEKNKIYLTNRIIKILFGENSDFEDCPVILCPASKGKFPLGTPAAERLEVGVTTELFREVASDHRCDYLLYNPSSGTKMYFEPKEYTETKGSKVMLSYYYRELMGVEKTDCLEILKYPKEKMSENSLHRLLDNLIEKILEFYIGSRTMEFRTCRSTHPVDDQIMIARLSQDMMNLLGVHENDYIWVKYGSRQISLKVFEMDTACEELEENGDNNADMLISIPALARQKLKMLDVKNVVKVKRDIRYCLRSHLSRQIFAILGTFLTVFTLSDAPLFRIICGIVAVPIILYFDFSEERASVKYKSKEK